MGGAAAAVAVGSTMLSMSAQSKASSAARRANSQAARQNADALAEQKSFNAKQLEGANAALKQQGEAFAHQAGLMAEQNALYEGQLSLMGEQFAQQQELQRSQFADAKARAQEQELKNDQALNRSRQKKPNSSKILGAARNAVKGGVKGTLLTGPGGVGKNDLSLGRSSLLGA